MTSENPGMSANFRKGVFGPEDIALLRTSYDEAWKTLSPDRQTHENAEVIAAAIIRMAAKGERDRCRVSVDALKSLTQVASHGAV